MLPDCRKNVLGIPTRADLRARTSEENEAEAYAFTIGAGNSRRRREWQSKPGFEQSRDRLGAFESIPEVHVGVTRISPVSDRYIPFCLRFASDHDDRGRPSCCRNHASRCYQPCDEPCPCFRHAAPSLDSMFSPDVRVQLLPVRRLLQCVGSPNGRRATTCKGPLHRSIRSHCVRHRVCRVGIQNGAPHA